MPVLACFRRLRLPTALVALSILAGPTAGAACLHAMAGPLSEVEHASAMPMEHAGDTEMPPCHDTPKPPAPADHAPHGPVGDCASPCCTVEAPAPETTPPLVVASASVPVPVAVAVIVEPRPAPVRVASATSPPPRPHLHADLQRFLL